MSQSVNPSSAPNAASKKVSNGIAGGILGLVLGAGATFLAAQYYYGPKKAELISIGSNGMPALPGPPPSQDASPAPSASDKLSLAVLVGELELLSRENLKLQLALDADQSAKIAAELADLEAAKSLSDEEAKTHREAIESLLTPQQKEILDSIGELFNRPAGGGGQGSGGPTGAPADENPFTQESNEGRLRNLLARLKTAG